MPRFEYKSRVRFHRPTQKNEQDYLLQGGKNASKSYHERMAQINYILSPNIHICLLNVQKAGCVIQ